MCYILDVGGASLEGILLTNKPLKITDITELITKAKGVGGSDESIYLSIDNTQMNVYDFNLMGASRPLGTSKTGNYHRKAFIRYSDIEEPNKYRGHSLFIKFDKAERKKRTFKQKSIKINQSYIHYLLAYSHSIFKSKTLTTPHTVERIQRIKTEIAEIYRAHKSKSSSDKFFKDYGSGQFDINISEQSEPLQEPAARGGNINIISKGTNKRTNKRTNKKKRKNKRTNKRSNKKRTNQKKRKNKMTNKRSNKKRTNQKKRTNKRSNKKRTNQKKRTNKRSNKKKNKSKEKE